MQSGGIKDLIYNLLFFKRKPSKNYNSYCLLYYYPLIYTFGEKKKKEKKKTN